LTATIETVDTRWRLDLTASRESIRTTLETVSKLASEANSDALLRLLNDSFQLLDATASSTTDAHRIGAQLFENLKNSYRVALKAEPLLPAKDLNLLWTAGQAAAEMVQIYQDAARSHAPYRNSTGSIDSIRTALEEVKIVAEKLKNSELIDVIARPSDLVSIINERNTTGRNQTREYYGELFEALKHAYAVALGAMPPLPPRELNLLWTAGKIANELKSIVDGTTGSQAEYSDSIALSRSASTRPAAALAFIAAKLLPKEDRERYTEEFLSELWEIANAKGGRLKQVSYSTRQLFRAPPTRLELREWKRSGVSP
jgi:hypothetical protein